MTGPIVNLNQLLAIPSASLAPIFGIKTAGVVRLMAAQAGSPVAYRVPPGFAIPANRHRDLSTADLRGAFDDLIQGGGDQGALMARSSSLHEAPGQNPTLFVGYDRRSSGKAFERFRDAVHRVGESASDMGVLLMPMVHGGPLSFEGGTALGATNASFVADSHHPLTPDELSIAMVTGLGTRVVDANADFIPITAERATGRITSIVNKTDHEILSYSGSVANVLSITEEEYRQRLLDAFSLKRDRIQAFPLKELEPFLGCEFASRPWLMIENGGLRAFNFKDTGRNNLRATEKVHYLGVTPLEMPGSLLNLVGAMRYLADLSPTPFQLEGAFVPPSSEQPVLYQYIELPPVQRTDEALDLNGAVLASSQVIGTCDFHGPLVVCNHSFIAPFSTETATRLEFFDRLYAATGYALLASHHSSTLMALTPGCTIRLSRYTENLSSHAVTYTRSQIAQNREKPRVIATNVTTASNFPESSFLKRTFFNTMAHIRSNGRQLRVDLPPPAADKTPPAKP